MPIAAKQGGRTEHPQRTRPGLIGTGPTRVRGTQRAVADLDQRARSAKDRGISGVHCSPVPGAGSTRAASAEARAAEVGDDRAQGQPHEI